MANIPSLEEILGKLEKTEKIDNAVLVSRSGMHIAGKVPEGAHLETFVAMSAILLGASETASSELNENVDHVLLDLENSRLAVVRIDPGALLVMKLGEKIDIPSKLARVKKYIKRIQENL